jgi:hypothetical protein
VTNIEDNKKEVARVLYTSARKQKIYLETTLFNFYIDKSRGEAHESTVRLFKEISEGKYEAFTSTYVTNELEKAEKKKKDEMLNLIPSYKITVLSASEGAERIARIYVDQGVIPKRYETDGLHIATAAVNELDMIISMNFEHIVKRKTIIMTEAINKVNGYHAVEIYSPMEVIENE